ncbi:MAG: HAD family hydrolase [Bacteroidales bacterium]
MARDFKIIGFDADDTLWVNEPFYQTTESDFCEILKPYAPEKETRSELFKTEIRNLELYGYGAKGFVLSMVETAIRISGGQITATETERILEIGKALMNMPVVLLDNTAAVLKKLQTRYKLILATKGDLLDQERKLEKSGLITCFHHIEIMSDKREENYLKLIRRLDIEPEDFIMIGNSIKSDVLPVINIGASAIHVPYETTWQHENDHALPDNSKYFTVVNLADVLKIIPV